MELPASGAGVRAAGGPAAATGGRRAIGRSAYLAPAAQGIEWALLLRGWTSDVLVLTDARFEVPAEARARLELAGVRIEERRLRRIIARGPALEAIELEDGARIARDVLFARPPQRQPELVARLGLELDEQGFVRVDGQLQTSRPGIHAAGDLTTMIQGALVAAAAGMQAAAAMNHGLTAELAVAGALP